MALATYNDLLIAIGNWLQRSDITSLFPDFVTLFEANMNGRLRARLQTLVTQSTTTNGQFTLPNDYQGMQRVTYLGSPRRDLEYIEPEMLAYNYPTWDAGIPQVYSIEGQVLTAMPFDDTAPIEYAYFQRVPPLSSAINWVYQGYPNLYLFGSLVEAQAYAVDPQKGSMWQQRRDDIYDDIFKNDFRHRSGPTIKVRGATP